MVPLLFLENIKSYVEFIDFDIWDIITDDLFMTIWIKDDDATIAKSKEKLNRNKKECEDFIYFTMR